jgi:hypothetical protein
MTLEMTLTLSRSGVLRVGNVRERSQACPPNLKRHTFRGVGWIAPKDLDGFVPGIVTISNCIDPRTNALLPEILPTFVADAVFGTVLPGRCTLTNHGITSVEMAGARRFVH